MAAQRVVKEKSNTASASQMKEFFRQVSEGDLTARHLQAIVQHTNPFGFGSVQVERVLSVPMSGAKVFDPALVLCGDEGPVREPVDGGPYVTYSARSICGKFSSKIEKDVPEALLQLHKLRPRSAGSLLEIIPELGPDHEIAFAHLWGLIMATDEQCQELISHSGISYLAYIRDAKNQLRGIEASFTKIPPDGPWAWEFAELPLNFGKGKHKWKEGCIPLYIIGR